jgi:hypothetical protein
MPPGGSVVRVTAIPNAGGASETASATADIYGGYVSSKNESHDYNFSDPPFTETWTEILSSAFVNGGADDQTLTSFGVHLDEPYSGTYTYNWPSDSWPNPGQAGSFTIKANGITSGPNPVGANVPALNGPGQQHCDAKFSYTESTGPVETYSENSQTEISLCTGGPPGSTLQNLWVVTATATPETLVSGSDPRSDIPEDIPFGMVDFTQVSVGDFGHLDSTGHAYKVLADNATNVDITPTVSGNDHFSFTVVPVKCPVRIYEGVTDITDSSVTTIAGALMNLTCGDSCGAPIDSYKWTIPGTSFSNWVANANDGILYTDFPKNNYEVNYYWVDSGVKQVTCTVQIGGQSIDVHSTFNVLRPTSDFVTTTGVIDINSAWGSLRLTDGIQDSEGLTIYPTVSVPDGFQCALQWVQLVDSEAYTIEDTSSNWFGLNVSGAGGVLDSPFPYAHFAHDNGIDPADSPGFRLRGIIYGSYSATYTMWLLYQPSNGSWVPLRKITWNWAGSASWDGNIWNKGSDCSNPDPGNGVETIDFPQWQSNIGQFTLKKIQH